MAIKSTTSKSNNVFGYIREAIKYGTLMSYASYPSRYLLANKRLNCNHVYCDQYFTTVFKKVGKVKLRLYKNDLEIITNSKVSIIPDLDRYYIELPTITIQETDSTISALCNEILRLIYEV